MKNYFKQNPTKLIFPLLALIFGIALNIHQNINFTSLALSLFIGSFTLIIVFMAFIQVWGEYKQIEGFWPAIKQFFKW